MAGSDRDTNAAGREEGQRDLGVHSAVHRHRHAWQAKLSYIQITLRLAP